MCKEGENIMIRPLGDRIVIKVIEDTEICIEFTTNISPVLFKPVVSNEFTYVVLPIKIKQD